MRINRHKEGFGWSGIKTEKYKSKDSTWHDVLRRTLIGAKGEECRFHLRYFEIGAGGSTSYECHKHIHAVICVRGRGICRAGKKRYTLGFLDHIYIPPEMEHSLFNPFDEPFGFLCAVDSVRDKPRAIKGK